MAAPSVQINSFVLDQTNGITVSEAIDAPSTPLQLDVKDFIRRSGGKLTTATYKPKLLTLNGVVIGSSFSDLDAKIDALKNAAVGTALNLDINNGSVTKRYIVHSMNDGSFTRSAGEVSMSRFSLSFVATDPPFAQDAVQGAASPTTSSGLFQPGVTSDVFTGSFTFLGSAPPAVKTQFTVNTPGSLTDLEFVDYSNSRTLKVSNTFSAGDVVVIDADQKKVQKNDIDVDFTGQFPNFQTGSQQMGANFYTSTGQTLDTSQTTSNGDYPLISTNGRFAQSFIASTTGPLTRVSLILSNVGAGANLTFSIQTDSSGVPSGTALTNSTYTIPSSGLTAIPNWYNVSFPLAPTVTGSTKYWIVLTPTSNSLTDYASARTIYPQTYVAGSAAVSTNGGSSWATLTSKGFSFKVYRGVLGETNQTADTDSFTEAFTATTYKDAANTTANWNTSSHQLVQNGVPTTLQVSQLADSNSVRPYSSTGPTTYGGGRFSIPLTASLTSMVFKLSNQASPPSSTIHAYIYNDVSVSGGSVYLGTLIGTSTNSINLNALSTTPTETTFNFSGVTLTAGQTYCIVLDDPSGTSGSRLIIEADWSSFASFPATVSFNSFLAYNTGMIYTGYSGGTGQLYYRANYTYTDYTANETGQSLTASTTNADIIQAAVTATATLASGGALGLYASSDGTNLEAVTNGAAYTFTNIGAALKWKAVLSGAAQVASYVSQVAISYIPGMALDATTKRAAQSFVPSSTGNIQRVDLYAAITGAPGSLTVRIETDSSGSPSGTLVNGNAAVTVLASNFSGVLGWVAANFPAAFSVTSGTTYWIVISGASLTAANKYVFQANNNRYAAGVMKRSTNSGAAYSGFASGEDLMFRFFQASGANFNVDLNVTYVKRYL
jgi:hypothetical protein